MIKDNKLNSALGFTLLDLTWATQEHTSTTLGMFKLCNFPHFVCYQKFDPKIWFFYEGECLDPFTYEWLICIIFYL